MLFSCLSGNKKDSSFTCIIFARYSVVCLCLLCFESVSPNQTRGFCFTSSDLI